MVKYLVVLKQKPDFALVAYPRRSLAEKYLKKVHKISEELAKCYNWNELPEFEIKEMEVEKW